MSISLKRVIAVSLSTACLSSILLAGPALAIGPGPWHGQRGEDVWTGAVIGGPMDRTVHRASYGYCNPYSGCGYQTDRGYGYYPAAPEYGVVPYGGNSGGAIFPHPGT